MKIRLLTAAVLLIIAFIVSDCGTLGYHGPGSPSDPVVVLETSEGNIFIKLFRKEAPIGVENFLQYVREGFYDGLIFHRVIDGFIIQGGGYDEQLQERQTHDPIPNEATNGLRNLRATVTYARTDDISSATSQFFINLKNNRTLDHRSNTPRGYGYAVFGKVVRGMAVADNIGKVRTVMKNGMQNVPAVPIVIKKAFIFEPEH